MRRVAITGHTSGLGAALFERFSVSDMVVGLSRSNGFDIRKIDPILKRIDECDVFINNAYDRYSQVDLLYAIYKMWKDENKKIINISSMSSEGIKKYIHPYAIHKKALDSAFDQIVSQKSKCKIINIKPSWIDTPSVKTVDAEKMCPKKLSNFIYDLSNIDLNIREVKIEV